MKLYGLKTCDTCLKAIKALPQATFVDVRLQGLPTDILQKALAEFGAALINRRSTTWRGLSGAERELAADVLLSEHPVLMKRPLIVDGDGMHLGWDSDAKAALGADQS